MKKGFTLGVPFQNFRTIWGRTLEASGGTSELKVFWFCLIFSATIKLPYPCPYLYITVPANTGVIIEYNLFFSFHIRSFDSSWINIIKDTILNWPGGIVTVFSVMLDPSVFINCYFLFFFSVSLLIILKSWFLIPISFTD